MCIRPNMLADGQLVACRLCWQCKERRIEDWMGRCIAENRNARASHFVTLTYGKDDRGVSDHMRARVLTYSDVQKFLKLLRRHGYPMRYICAGEYGSKKGRCHWHLVIFWLDRVPPVSLNKRYDWVIQSEDGSAVELWPHGFVKIEKPGSGSVRYVCKYIQKDVNDPHNQAHFSISKKPPLGAAYFKQLAERYVENGLSPQNLFYEFDEARGKNGKRIRFKMAGATAKLFLQHYVDMWPKKWPNRHWPWSEPVEDYLNGLVPEDNEIAPRPYAGRVPKPEGDDLMAFMDPTRIYFDEKLNCYAYHFEFNQTPWYWVRRDGELEWRNDLKGRMEPSTTSR